jgi:formylglycine-generating enzyme required for sulfatase activity
MPTHQELPEQFGRYRILKKLGAGGMGAVYLAEDTRMRRKVALKVPHFSAATRAAGLERFQREARLAGSIDHPNFCAVYDVDEIDGIHYFTMAYLEGTPLSGKIAGGKPWPARLAVEMVRRVALAVAELHNRGIVHRDLKPANIMVRPSGEPVLMDFGLACSVTSESEPLTGTGEVLGTPTYISPEQLEGDRARLTPAADVYSLGMILYQLLTGQVPFSGPLLVVVAQVRDTMPESPSTLQHGLDPRLDAICLKALAKKPEERFSDMYAFVTALEEFLDRSGEQRLHCPQCGKGLKVPASMAGRKLKCPQCGTSLATATLAPHRPAPLPSRQETVPLTGHETAARPFRSRTTTGRRRILVLLSLLLIVTGLVVGAVLLWPRKESTPEAKPFDKETAPKQGEEPPPPPMASLRLERLESVRLEAGQKKTVPVKVRRENYSGPVRVEAVAASPGVTVLGRVDEKTEEGGLELTVAADAKPGERSLRLRAVALDGSAHAEGQLSLTIQAVDRPPPPKPSLRLEEFAAVSVEAGKTKTVPVTIKREGCPGPVQVELVKESPGVTVRNGFVGNDKEEGTLELKVDPEAKTGPRTLRLRAVAAEARTEGDLPLTVELPDRFVNQVQMQMVRIKKGTFKMGTPAFEEDKVNNELAQHPVKITQDFYMGATEVTVGQFRQFVENKGYKTEAETDGRGGWGYDEITKLPKPKLVYNWKNTGWKQGESYPVVNVTWNDAVAFCKWLSKKEGKEYDLPTEAEWEYACRAGTTTGYHSGDNVRSLIEVGNVADATFKARFPRETKFLKGDDGYVFTAPVKQFKPNAWGLYDLHGNVWEWCKDGPRPYPDAAMVEKRESPIEDPEGPLDGPTRVLRGGSWSSNPKFCRSAYRSQSAPGYRDSQVGFRVVLRPNGKAP